MAEAGLRERKKRQTRQAISEAARALFLERGFAAVTIAEVARAADVSEQTVFNHFRTKEDLFFSGMQAFESKLVDAVRSRAPGESALRAFRRALLDRTAALAQPGAAEAIESAARLIAATRALQNREREVLAEHARALAEVLAEDEAPHPGSVEDEAPHPGSVEDEAPHPGSVEAVAVATALLGVHAALLDHVRELVLRGIRGRELVDAVEAEGARACDRLERGLGDYAVRRGAG